MDGNKGTYGCAVSSDLWRFWGFFYYYENPKGCEGKTEVDEGIPVCERKG